MAPDPPDGEQRNGSDQVLRQMVWGLGYVDELVQVGINRDPQNATTSYDGAHQENECERFFWACCDANYNVLGLVGGSADINDFGGGGYLAERYEYSPYGKRAVFSHGWLQSDINGDGKLNIDDYGILDHWIGTSPRPHRVELALDLNGDGRFNGDDYAVLDTQIGQGGAALANDPQVLYARLSSFRGPIHTTNVMAAASLNEFGHQGLMEDEETGLIYNRGRMLNPGLGRFLQRDPLGLAGGTNLYEYLRSSPNNFWDPFGLLAGAPVIVRVTPGPVLVIGGLVYIADELGQWGATSRSIAATRTSIYSGFSKPLPGPRVTPTSDGVGDLKTSCPVAKAKKAKKNRKRRTAEENKKARNKFKNNKNAARKAYTERTGKEWPVDEHGNPWPAEHTPPLKEGGDPMVVTPRDPGAPDPHNIPGPDGLTDYQRWGAEGTPARQANQAK